MSTKPLTPAALCSRLEWVEVDSAYPADFRRLVCNHRQALTMRLRRGDAAGIATKVRDIAELFDLWGWSGDLNATRQ